MKLRYQDWFGESPSGDSSFIFGAVAAAMGVCVMIPMDTVKTRLVLQVVDISHIELIPAMS